MSGVPANITFIFILTSYYKIQNYKIKIGELLFEVSHFKNNFVIVEQLCITP